MYPYCPYENFLCIERFSKRFTNAKEPDYGVAIVAVNYEEGKYFGRKLPHTALILTLLSILTGIGKITTVWIGGIKPLKYLNHEFQHRIGNDEGRAV